MKELLKHDYIVKVKPMNDKTLEKTKRIKVWVRLPLDNGTTVRFMGMIKKIKCDEMY